MAVHAYNLVHRRLRQEELESEARLGYCDDLNENVPSSSYISILRP